MLRCAPYYYTHQKPGRYAPRTSKVFQCFTIDVFGALPESSGNTGPEMLNEMARWLGREFTDHGQPWSMVPTRPLPLDFLCLGLGNLAVSQPSCFFWVAQQVKNAGGRLRSSAKAFWLKSLTARQRCLAGNADALPFQRNKSPHVPTPNLEDRETILSGGEMAQWLEREFTDWKVHGSKPISASRLPLSRLGKSGSIPSLVLPSVHGCTWAGILLGRSHLDRRTIRVLNQSLWLKSLTARQRCLAGNANALLFLRNNSPHVPTPNLEDQETVFVRPLAIDQPGMRDSVSVAGTLPSIAQWVAEVRKPPHHASVESLVDLEYADYVVLVFEKE
ncbi:hypothetical protein CSKR_101861 [Clonorchis sinensis]|uniref:Uncharacterized protein n=1 Tax=Clonorchis sinensis TaxID=79923 RepID=A0A419QBK4_CLOSI|nr:hypothetical protein CSKR_101861 [Clonorchis sinensis]